MDAKLINLSDVNGVGTKLITILNKQGLYTVKDLLLSLPYRYDSFEPMSLYRAKMEAKACFSGKIITPITRQFYRPRLNSITFSISAENEAIKVIVFNRDFLAKVLKPGSNVMVSGKYNPYRKELTCQEIFPNTYNGHIEAKYHIKDIPAKTIQKIVNNALLMGAEIDEYLPTYCIDKYNFMKINEMIRSLHNPTSLSAIKDSQRRRKYEEILEFYIRLNHFKSLRLKETRDPINYDINKVKEVIKSIPFELTKDQKEACNQIFTDFKNIYPTNRIIQGDVGSGKTIVALIAAYAFVTASKQVEIMAPTEILAKQHYAYFKSVLEHAGVNIVLYTSSTSKAIKKIMSKDISSGSVDIVIGTHALFYDNFKFKNLGLAIIDEQHRFGVNARNKLLNNGDKVDAIYLSATPIPRTLALTIFSDLDISVIKTVRSDKKAIKTEALLTRDLDKVFNRLNDELKQGHQAYFVTSAISSEDDERFDLEEVDILLKQNFPNAKIGMLHGKMKDEEKNNVMDMFINKEYDILISTTVIEVGISVDNATMITILDAQNFGLASLHQLRGRVGRGGLQGYCYLLTNDLDIDRIKVMEESTDGFYLAEQDLKNRGPGEYFGMRQSGMSDFIFANFKEDLDAFRSVNEDSKIMLSMKDKDKEIDKYIKRVLEALEFNASLN